MKEKAINKTKTWPILILIIKDLYESWQKTIVIDSISLPFHYLRDDDLWCEPYKMIVNNNEIIVMAYVVSKQWVDYTDKVRWTRCSP